MPPRSRRPGRSDDQPALPLDLGAPMPAAPRPPRSSRRTPVEAAVQLTMGLTLEDEDSVPSEETAPVIEPESRVAEPGATMAFAEIPPAEAEWPKAEPEPPAFDPEPFAEIPGFARAVSVAREFVLLPGSLRSRLDLREFTRFLASLPTTVKDWDGAPEIEEGGIRLRGPEGGAWLYPEASRVRVVTDGAIAGPVGEDLVALCRWLDGRAGMRLYPAGETRGAGADRSLDPWETFG